MLRLAAAVILAALPATGVRATEAGLDGKAAFEKLKSLAGEWRGTIEKAGGPAAGVQYRLASGGSVVMETLFPGSEHEMISMYHLDGERLVLTHYCAMANQPRMQLTSATAAELRFDFEGGANVDPKTTRHVHSGRIAFVSADKLEAEWDVHAGGQRVGSNHFFLERKSVR